ncbi:hypothetical protein LTR10_010095 [Elasticomyces elasticus]|nr:hypothetical protein LTR10_010095 [Elasticomyces elasticus]KAK4970387.1 hypothetical protein LTR42_008554 [Elasticomyces elasticus]
MSAPQKPLLNGNHKGDGTKANVGGTGSGSNAPSGGGGGAIQDTISHLVDCAHKKHLFSASTTTSDKMVTTIDLTIPEAAQPHDTGMLDVPELLENVLLYLPLRDIIQAQRVSKYWLNSIESSPKVQQALFPRPSATILRQNADLSSDLRQTACPVVGIQIINPQGHPQPFAIASTGFGLVTYRRGALVEAKQSLSSSSLGRMLIRQPPVCALLLRPNVYHSGGERHASVAVRNHNGLTIKNVCQQLEGHVSGCWVCKTDGSRIDLRSHRHTTWWTLSRSNDLQGPSLKSEGWAVLAMIKKAE